MNAVLDKLSQPQLDPDTQRNVEELRRLKEHAGLLDRDEATELAKQIVQEQLGAIEQQRRQEQDRAELESVLKEFDGTNAPKVTTEEISTFLQKAQGDPRLSHWADPNVSFREIVQHLKQKEIVEFQVNSVLKQGKEAPPKVEKGQGGPIAPTTKRPRFDDWGKFDAYLKGLNR